jgi:UDP-N-acetylglucosamine 2-epimerase
MPLNTIIQNDMNAFIILTGQKFDSEMLYQSEIYGRLDFTREPTAR